MHIFAISVVYRQLCMFLCLQISGRLLTELTKVSFYVSALQLETYTKVKREDFNNYNGLHKDNHNV